MKSKIKIYLAAMLVILLLSSTGGCELTRERLSHPADIPTAFTAVSSDVPVTGKWYLGLELMHEENSFLTEHFWNYTWDSSNIGQYHDITFVGTNIYGTSSSMIWTVYIGTRFVVPNDTAIVEATTLSTIAAPGEDIEIITKISPAKIGHVAGIYHLATSSAMLLVQPNEEGVYYCPKISSNDTTFIYTCPAATNNGTFLVGLNLPVAENEAGNNVPISITNAEVIVSPRYDIGGAGGKPDFVVNIIDLTILRQHYGEIIPVDVEPPRYDIDKNRIVNIIDLTILKQNYGKTIPTV